MQWVDLCKKLYENYNVFEPEGQRTPWTRVEVMGQSSRNGKEKDIGNGRLDIGRQKSATWLEKMVTVTSGWCPDPEKKAFLEALNIESLKNLEYLLVMMVVGAFRGLR